MINLESFIKTWTGITTYYFFFCSIVLLLILVLLFVFYKIDSYFATFRPKNRIEQGYGGYETSFMYMFYTLYILLILFTLGAVLLAPIIALLRSIITSRTYPTLYYFLVSLLVIYLFFYYFLDKRYRKMLNTDNYFFIAKGVLILKFNKFFGYIPLKFLTSIQIDKGNKLIKFVFKIRIFKLIKTTPRWIFEFTDEETFNSLVHGDLQDYDYIKEFKNLKRKKFLKLLPRMPIQRRTTFEEVKAELPEPILTIFTLTR